MPGQSQKQQGGRRRTRRMRKSMRKLRKSHRKTHRGGNSIFNSGGPPLL
jgi:hypothetical protein